MKSKAASLDESRAEAGAFPGLSFDSACGLVVSLLGAATKASTFLTFTFSLVQICSEAQSKVDMHCRGWGWGRGMGGVGIKAAVFTQLHTHTHTRRHVWRFARQEHNTGLWG